MAGEAVCTLAQRSVRGRVVPTIGSVGVAAASATSGGVTASQVRTAKSRHSAAATAVVELEDDVADPSVAERNLENHAGKGAGACILNRTKHHVDHVRADDAGLFARRVHPGDVAVELNLRSIGKILHDVFRLHCQHRTGHGHGQHRGRHNFEFHVPHTPIFASIYVGYTG